MSNLTRHLVLVLLISVLASIGGFSQTEAQGPPPPDELAQGAQPLSQVEVLKMPLMDVQQLLQEDEQRAIQGLPLRFAQPIPVQVSPSTHGTWEQLNPDTRLWRLRISSPDAVSLNLGFTRYIMPPGGRLFLYTPDYSQIVGPFTDEDNEGHGQLWTPILLGDEIVIEVTLPAAVTSQLELQLTSVNHGYTGFGHPRADKSGACNVDVACPEGDDWRDEIRSVAAYSTGGSLFCSGSLLNNTAQDLTPYFLTANHCGINATNAPSMVVYWNYENSTCRTPGSPESGQPGDGTLDQFNTGAIFRAAYAPSDMTLVELDDPIDPAFNVHWAGWDNTSADPTSATAIHHPNTDEKRISFEDDPTTTTSYLSTSVPGDGTHIRVIDWDLGTTEVGSSGSPLFNQDHRVVGQLHGGYAACGNDLSDWYGRLSVSWNGGATSATRLQDWLDPGDTGATVLDGRDKPPVPRPMISEIHYDPNISAGEYSEIFVRVLNAGGESDEGSISISFPAFTDPNDDQYVQFIHTSPDCEYTPYPHGDTIYDRDGDPFSANYLLIESVDTSWENNEENTLTIRVYPQEEGTFEFYVRSAMGLNGTYINDPSSSSYTDQQGWEVHRYTITVEGTVNTPPTLSGLPDRTLNEDTSLDNTIDLWAYASDNETHVSGLSYTIDNSPDPNAGVAVDPNDYIDINPTANWCGWTDVRIRVTDPGGLWDTDTFRVTVNCLNDLPWISPTVPDQSGAQDQPITIDLTAYEHDVEDSGTALDWYVTDEFNCTVSGEYSDNDVLIFTPEPDFVGSETVTLHLVDSGGAEDTQDVTLTWSSTNTPPTLSGLPDRTLDEDASLDNTIDLWAYASDGETPDSGLTYTIDNNPNPNAGVAVDPDDYIDINPTANWCGWTDVRIRVTDPGGLWDTDTFRVTVNCINDLPWISPTVPDQSEAQDQPITIDLTAYEHDVEDSGTSLDWHVTGEDNCTVTGEYSHDDVLTFTPDGGFVASDTVTLHLVDSGGGEATQDVTLTWSSSGTPPTLSGLPDRTLDEDASLDNTIDLWAYASDGETPDSGLTYTIDNVPAAGAGVTIDSNRYIDVNPVADWCGWTDVTIRVTDPGGLWDTDTFRVAVNCVNDPPNTPSAPNPADGATDVSITADLSWMGGDPDAGDTVTYDAYFEANDSTPGNLICDGVSPPLVCDPGTLAYDTHYYWYVIATDNHGGSTTGDTWDFYTVTEPPVCEPILQVFEPQVSGDHVTINGVVTPQPGCPAIARIHWNWGDGQEHDSWFAAEHTYGALGTYLVTVTAYDLEGHTAVQTTQVDIVTLPVELYYDDGQVDAAWATGPLGGAAVLFTPPEVPWLLSEIKVAGWYARSDAPFYVEIWDSGRNELLHKSYTYSQFFGYETLTWAEIDIPDVVVDGDFYVCVFPNDSEDHILWLGFDNDPPISYRSYDVRYDTNSVEYGPHDDWDWTIRATGVALPPPAPSLSAPPNGSSTCDTIPTFSWGNVSGATSYCIQVDNNSDFSSPEINRITSSTSYTPGSPLSPGTHYWRVRASNSCGNGSWSSAWSVTILSTPAAVSLSSPSNGASVGDNPPTFSWGSVSGATSYHIQVDDNSSFSSPEIDRTTSNTSYTPGSALAGGATYYWRVRASNTCGSGPWSARWRFTTPAPATSEFWIYLPAVVRDHP